MLTVCLKYIWAGNRLLLAIKWTRGLAIINTLVNINKGMERLITKFSLAGPGKML